MKRKVLILVSLIYVLSLFVSFSDEVSSVYYVAGDIHFPPYEYLDEDGLYKGFNVDLLKAIGLVMGMEFVFLPMPWEDAFHAIDRGQADIIQGMKVSEARKHKFHFTDSLLFNSQSIFVKNESYTISTNSDLVGKRVSVLKEDIVYYDLAKIKDIEILEYDTVFKATEALLSGNVDAMVANTLSVNYICNDKGWSDEVKIVGQTLNEQKYALAVSKENTQLLNQLNEGLKEVHRSGLYDTLHRKWFGTPIKHINDGQKALTQVFLIFALVLFAIVYGAHFFNKKLKAIIEEKTREEKVLINELRNYDKLQFMDKIISSLAHEIRNPLTSIKLYTTQMQSKLDNPAFMMAAAADIPEEIDRIEDLIKEFMAYTTPKKPQIRVLHLKSELESAIKFIKYQMKDIEIAISIPENLEVAFDPGHFKQLVINILLNSKDALAGHASPKVNIEAALVNAHVALTFSDNGCGMEETALNYLFEPFFTTKENGNGVGMFIVKKLVEENLGSIAAGQCPKLMGLSVKISLQRGAAYEA